MLFDSLVPPFLIYGIIVCSRHKPSHVSLYINGLTTSYLSTSLSKSVYCWLGCLIHHRMFWFFNHFADRNLSYIFLFKHITHKASYNFLLVFYSHVNYVRMIPQPLPLICAAPTAFFFFLLPLLLFVPSSLFFVLSTYKPRLFVLPYCIYSTPDFVVQPIPNCRFPSGNVCQCEENKVG